MSELLHSCFSGLNNHRIALPLSRCASPFHHLVMPCVVSSSSSCASTSGCASSSHISKNRITTCFCASPPRRHISSRHHPCLVVVVALCLGLLWFTSLGVVHFAICDWGWLGWMWNRYFCFRLGESEIENDREIFGGWFFLLSVWLKLDWEDKYFFYYLDVF